jgi:3-deoxy-D-manno-octulosonic acid kinase
VLGDRYVRLGETRPLRELRASAAARARGVATPEIVAAVAYGAGPVYRADLATVRVPHSADLADTVLGPARRPPAERLAAWQAAGALLRRAFGAGVVHADLNLRNILIQRGTPHPTAFLLDLDRAVVRNGGAGDVARQRMLGRLHRSRRKLEAELGSTVTAAELAAFDDAVGER